MATINDIARMANVSTTTVSHVVNKTRYVSPELVERVEKAIREAGDVPNFIAKKTALSSDSFETQYIVVLVTNKESNFQKQVVKEFGFLASVSKYTLITLICDDDINAQQDFYRVIFKSKTVAGVIAFPDKGNNVFSNILAAEKNTDCSHWRKAGQLSCRLHYFGHTGRGDACNSASNQKRA